MRSAAECLLKCFFRAEEEVASCFHASADNDGLSDFAQGGCEFLAAGAKAACGSFAVDEEFFLFAVNVVFFEFGDVVRNVVHQVHFHFFRALFKDSLEAFADAVQDDLSVCECHVGGARHCLEIILAFFAGEWRAGKFGVADRNAFAFHDIVEYFEIVGCDLVAKAAGAAVDHNADLVG